MYTLFTVNNFATWPIKHFIFCLTGNAEESNGDAEMETGGEESEEQAEVAESQEAEGITNLKTVEICLMDLAIEDVYKLFDSLDSKWPQDDDELFQTINYCGSLSFV